MKSFKEFKIPFIGLKEEKHNYSYQIDEKFFDAFGYDEFQKVKFDVDLTFNKKVTMLELDFEVNGTIQVPCDVTGDEFDLEVKGEFTLIVKFGDKFNNENEELLILPHGAYEIEVQQYIYELIILSVPQKRIKPEVESKETTQAGVLKEEKKKEESKNDIDPRWDQLKKLLGK